MPRSNMTAAGSRILLLSLCFSLILFSARTNNVLAQSPPSITSVVPTQGTFGTLVTIYGSNFVEGNTKVKFSGYNTEYPIALFVSSQEVKFIVPKIPASPSYDLTVVTPYGLSNAVKFSIPFGGPEAVLNGIIYDSVTGEPITNAMISIHGQVVSPESHGFYLTMVPAGTYTVSASAEGYIEKSYYDVVFLEGDIVTRDFWLEPLSASPNALPAILPLLLTD